jgi:predicted RNA polymerase sigma factor
VLQAAIAACHARAFRARDTDWAQITGLYAVLAQVMPGPVVELNRAVATSMAFGPQAGLDLVDALAGEAALSGYHLLPSVRAAAMTRNTAERDLSAARARGARAQAGSGAGHPGSSQVSG